MSQARPLFSRLHGITFNIMANLFIIVNSDRSHFGSLVDHFRSGNPEVVNSYMDWIEALREAIDSHLCVVDDPPTVKPSALRGSAPTPVPPPKSNRPKTTSPPGGTHTRYPPMRPKWGKFTDLAKANKVCCACFCAHMWSQVCMPLAHVGLAISNNPEGAQLIISAIVEKKKTWEEANNHAPTSPNPRGQCATSSDIPPPPPIPANDPTLATTRPN